MTGTLNSSLRVHCSRSQTLHAFPLRYSQFSDASQLCIVCRYHQPLLTIFSIRKITKTGSKEFHPLCPPTPIIFLSEEPVVFVLGCFLTDLHLEYQSLLLPTQTIISHGTLLSKVLLKSRQIRSKAFPMSRKAHGVLCLLSYFFSFLITKSYQVSLTQVTLVKPCYIFIIFFPLHPCLQSFLQNCFTCHPKFVLNISSPFSLNSCEVSPQTVCVTRIPQPQGV